MKFERLDSRENDRAWLELWKTARAESAPFMGFCESAEKLWHGDHQLFHRFEINRYGLIGPDAKGPRLLAVAQHFRVLDKGLPFSSALGGLLFHPSLSHQEIRDFAVRLLAATGPIDWAPFNAHMNLGLSHPAAETSSERIGFLCTAKNAQVEYFLESTGCFRRKRKLLALQTRIDPSLRPRLISEQEGLLARGFSTRPLSLIHFRREVEIYNSLVNQAMTQHDYFFPLSFSEEWDLMKAGFLVFKRSWFRFLIYEGREIGFCFALPDYNSMLSSEGTDAANLMRILKGRISGFSRARLVYSVMHPDFQGQGLVKAVRHSVILEMIKDGVREFESSYVDENNVSSLENVRSQGGRESHAFYLYGSV